MADIASTFIKTKVGNLKLADYIYKAIDEGQMALDITDLSIALSSEIQSLSVRLSTEISCLDFDRGTSDLIREIGENMLNAIRTLCVNLSTETDNLSSKLSNEIDDVNDQFVYYLDKREGGTISDDVTVKGDLTVNNADLIVKSFYNIKDFDDDTTLQDKLNSKQDKVLTCADGIIGDHVTQAEVKCSGIELDTTVGEDHPKMLKYPVLSNDATLATTDSIPKNYLSTDFSAENEIYSYNEFKGRPTWFELDDGPQIGLNVNKDVDAQIGGKYFIVPDTDYGPGAGIVDNELTVVRGTGVDQISADLIATRSWANDHFSKIDTTDVVTKSGGGSISADVEIYQNNLSIINGNYVQTNTPDHAINYSKKNSYLQGECVRSYDGYGDIATGSRGFYIVKVVNGNTLKLSGDILQLTAYAGKREESGYPFNWSIALDNSMDSFFSAIKNVDVSQHTVEFYNDFNSSIKELSSKSESYLKNLVSDGDDNAFYCPLKPNIGNVVIEHFSSNHAEGGSTHAIGQYAHAEGRATIADGRYSHAEGGDVTIAGGVASHAEGFGTRALGNRSHAEGSGSMAYGSTGAHAEGAATEAYGSASHAEGNTSKTYGEGSHAEGYHSTARGFASHAEGGGKLTDDYYVIGGYAHGSGSHAEGLSSFSSGIASHAEGLSCYAGGQASHAEGRGSLATGHYSHAEGAWAYESSSGGIGWGTEVSQASGHGSHAEGAATVSEGFYSHAEGFKSEATGNGSHAEGGFHDASHGEFVGGHAVGTASHAEGIRTTAEGNYSHVEGFGASTSSTATGAHAEGIGSKAIGSGSHAEGGFQGEDSDGGFAYGAASHAEGLKTKAYGNYSHVEGRLATTGVSDTVNGTEGCGAHAEGYNTTAKGQYSHAEGANSKAYGNWSHAEGNNTTAGTDESPSEDAAHAEGYFTQATKQASHAEGFYSIASEIGAHAEGGFSHNGSNYPGGNASGKASHAEGVQTFAIGWASHAAGYKAKAGQNYQFAWQGDTRSGEYNIDKVGTFCINPAGGIAGFYIGTQNLESILASYSSSSNFLSGKKLVVVGDSYSIAQESYDEGSKVTIPYPNIIAERNLMTLTNLSYNNMKMAANTAGSSDSKVFSVSGTTSSYGYKYPANKTALTNADYIVFQLGLNDGTSSSTVGTSSSIGNSTLWGAWNTVLGDIMNWNPKAKIGIIISDGWMNEDYSGRDCRLTYKALIDIAVYWGIPYLDLKEDPMVPHMLGNRIGLNPVVKTKHDTLFNAKVSGSYNLHPNQVAHEFRSTIIENFIKSL